jgi:hypothetical protein
LKNKIPIFALIFFNILFLIGEYSLYNRISGLFLGSIIGAIILICYNRIPLVDSIFKLLLFSNLLILIVNLFFRDFLIIPPLFSAGDNVFEQDIIRNISIGPLSIDLRRSTGIIDNIHVSTLLLLYLVFIYYKKGWNKFFFLSSILFFFTLNFQFILVYVLFFLLIRHKNFFDKHRKSLFFLIPIIFFIIDYLFLGQAYYYQITNSKFNLLILELSHYLNFLDLGSFLYGIKPNMIDDPYDSQAGFYVPLTDIGLIGVPIQFGLLGLFSIALNVVIGFKYFTGHFKLLFKLLLLTILHYFSLASFIGLLSTFWLSKYYSKIDK